MNDEYLHKAEFRKVFSMKRSFWAAAMAATAVLVAAGCEGDDPVPAKTEAKRGSARATKERDSDSPVPGGAKKKFAPIQLGDGAADTGAAADAKKMIPDEQRAQAIVAALQPFQILLGDWRWGTFRKFGDFAKVGEDLKWVWDFQSDPTRPALKGVSDANPYFQKVWLTYLPDDDKFQLTGKTPEGESRILQGTWADNGEPREESDGKKIQHTYKLALAQVSPAAGEQWQVTLSQLDNNQYLMVVSRSPAAGKQFGPLDTVRQQRVGTSFAVADSDNPGPKCIISGGLRSMDVEYKGKKYPVCCSGCAAAFNDDPERWLAKLAEREKQQKKDE
jgi:hypothetical protein